MKKITSIIYNSQEYAALKGDTGDTGPVGPVGPIGPQGATSVYDSTTQNFLTTLETTTGQDQTKTMSQKAITDNLTILSAGTEIDISSISEVASVWMNQDEWHAQNQQNACKFIPVTPGNTYIITPSSTYERGSHCVFLTNNDYTTGQKPSYAGGLTTDPGWSNDEGWSNIMVAPADAAYMYIRYKRSNTVVAPTKIELVSGTSLVKDAVANLMSQMTTVIEKTEKLSPSGDYSYYGDRISIKKNTFNYNWNFWKTLPSASVVQSHAIYGDYLINFNSSDNNLTAKLYDLDTNTLLETISMSYGSLTVPHCNVACFSNEFASGNSDLPLLYLSQWNGERGCIVYDINVDGTYSIVQTILPDISNDLLGAGAVDWVVDTDYGFIYAIGYKVADGSRVPESQGNKAMINKFRLPDTSVSEVTLTDNDIIDHYELPPFNIMQDKVYVNRRILIAAGGISTDDTTWRRIYSLNLDKRTIEAVVQMNSLKAQEPECLDIYNGKLVISYAESSHYGDLYLMEF